MTKKIELTSFEAQNLIDFFDMMEDSTNMWDWPDNFEVDEASFQMMVAAYHNLKNQL